MAVEERQPARGYSWPPFEKGNLAAAKSGYWASPMLRPDDRAEVEEIAASVRELLPVWRPEFEIAVEQLACRLWRQRRAYRDLAEHGIVRDGQPASILADLSKLERQIARDLDGFGLTPRSAAALGLSIASTERTLSLIDLHAAAALDGEAEEVT